MIMRTGRLSFGPGRASAQGLRGYKKLSPFRGIGYSVLLASWWALN